MLDSVTDGNIATCWNLPSVELETRIVAVEVLNYPYDSEIEVSIKGRNIACGASDGKCSADLSTMLYQQGRTTDVCDGSPLCLGASLCSHHATTTSGGGLTSCTYRCSCPTKTSAGQGQCSKLVVLLGAGSLVVPNQDMVLCEISLESVN